MLTQLSKKMHRAQDRIKHHKDHHLRSVNGASDSSVEMPTIGKMAKGAYGIAAATSAKRKSRGSIKGEENWESASLLEAALLYLPNSTDEKGFPLPELGSPIFSPAITVNDYGEEESEEVKLMKRYPDPRYDRYVDIIGPVVPVPLPNEVLAQWYKNHPDYVSRRVQQETVHNGRISFLDLPLNVRQNVYKYLLPDEDRKISVSHKSATREVFDDGYFARISEVRKPFEGARSSCFDVSMELNIFFWAKYKFHFTMNQFMELGRNSLYTTLFRDVHFVQHLTLELDYTRFAFSKAPGAWQLKPDVRKFENCARRLVDGLLARKDSMPFVHLMCRRWYGYREMEDTGGELIHYVPKEYLRSIHAFGELNNGRLSTFRMSGFSKAYTIQLFNLIYDGNPSLSTPADPPWPPVPLPASPKQKIARTSCGFPNFNNQASASLNSNRIASLSLNPDFTRWPLDNYEWFQNKKPREEHDSTDGSRERIDNDLLQVPRGRTRRISIEDRIATSRGPPISRLEISSARSASNTQRHIGGLIPSLVLPPDYEGPESDVFYGTLRSTPSTGRLNSRLAISTTTVDSTLFSAQARVQEVSEPGASAVCAGAMAIDNGEGGGGSDENKKPTIGDVPLPSSAEVLVNAGSGGSQRSQGSEKSASEDRALLNAIEDVVKTFDFPFLASARYDFLSSDPRDLGFVKGDLIVVSEYVEANEDRWGGHTGGRKGLFPKDLVHRETVLSYGIALFDYSYPFPEAPAGGCDFNVGDRIAIMAWIDDDYAYGLNLRTGKLGNFQRNYVHAGNGDVQAIAKQGSILCRAVMKAEAGRTMQRNKDSMMFRPGDQIDVLQYVDESTGFGQNVRTKNYGRFPNWRIHIFPANPVELCTVTAITDFKRDPWTEVGFVKGDEMIIIDYMSSTDFWYGKNVRTQQCGLIPVDHVRPPMETQSVFTTPNPLSQTSTNITPNLNNPAPETKAAELPADALHSTADKANSHAIAVGHAEKSEVLVFTDNTDVINGLSAPSPFPTESGMDSWVSPPKSSSVRDQESAESSPQEANLSDLATSPLLDASNIRDATPSKIPKLSTTSCQPRPDKPRLPCPSRSKNLSKQSATSSLPHITKTRPPCPPYSKKFPTLGAPSTPCRSSSVRQTSETPNKTSWRSASLRLSKNKLLASGLSSAEDEDATSSRRPNVLKKQPPSPKTPQTIGKGVKGRLSTPLSQDEEFASAERHRRSIMTLKSIFGAGGAAEKIPQPAQSSDEEITPPSRKVSVVKEEEQHKPKSSKIPTMSKAPTMSKSPTMSKAPLQKISQSGIPVAKTFRKGAASEATGSPLSTGVKMKGISADTPSNMGKGMRSGRPSDRADILRQSERSEHTVRHVRSEGSNLNTKRNHCKSPESHKIPLPNLATTPRNPASRSRNLSITKSSTRVHALDGKQPNDTRAPAEEKEKRASAGEYLMNFLEIPEVRASPVHSKRRRKSEM